MKPEAKEVKEFIVKAAFYTAGITCNSTGYIVNISFESPSFPTLKEASDYLGCIAIKESKE